MSSHAEHTHFVPTAPAVRRAFADVVFPSDWDCVHLEDCVVSDAPICYGILMPGSHVESGIPVVKVKDFAGNRLSVEGLLRTSEEIDGQYKRSRLRGGDLLLAIRGTTGDVAIVPDKLDGANITQDTARLRARTGEERQYLFYALQSQYVQMQITLDTIGQAVKGINIGSVRKLVIPFPDEGTRKAIAEVLSTWDRAIEQTEELIEAKKRRKKGLMQRLLTGDKRFPEFGRTPWQTAQLSKLFKRVTRKNGAGVDHVLTASGQHGLVDQRGYFNRSVAGQSLAGYYHLKRGEFAYNRSSMQGYPYGAIKRLDDYAEGVLSTLYICFALASERHSSDFFAHYFEAGMLNRQLRGVVQVGARAHGLLNVAVGDFFGLKVTVPSLPEQERIASVLNACDDEISLLRRKLEALKQQKKGLMQKLLTGGLRVSPRKETENAS